MRPPLVLNTQSFKSHHGHSQSILLAICVLSRQAVLTCSLACSRKQGRCEELFTQPHRSLSIDLAFRMNTKQQSTPTMLWEKHMFTWRNA